VLEPPLKETGLRKPFVQKTERNNLTSISTYCRIFCMCFIGGGSTRI
jgi:hypothetical protein